MRTRGWSFIVLISAAVAAPAHGQEPHVAQMYLDVMTRVWGEHGSLDDLEALGVLLADDAGYRHDSFGAEIQGREEIIGAMTQFLGASRSPELSHVRMVQTEDGWILSFHLSREIERDGEWAPVWRHHFTVLETEGGLITRVLDYR